MSHAIVIVGAGGHGRVLADLCRSIGREVAGFLDPAMTSGTRVDDYPILGGDEHLDDPTFVAANDFGLGLGDSALRCRLGRRILDAGGELPPLVHRSAVVASDVRIGRGVVLMAGAIVQCGSRLDDFVVVNTGATVDHDGELDEGVHVGPGVHLGGAVRAGRCALVGVGASIVPGIRIGKDAIVGAGAVVTRDVADGATVVGSPAAPVSKTG